MQADWTRLAKDYKSSRSVLIAEVDCTEHQNFCGKFGIQGYPTIKAFKKGSSKPDEYNSGRDYKSFKRYIEANLAGPECSLEDKAGCQPDELKLLEESEALSVGDRRAKIKVMEEEVKEKKALLKSLQKEIGETTKAIELFKLGGEKPERVEQLVGDAEFREHCEHRTCILAFLPHILDGGAAARNGLLKTLDTVFKKAKGDSQPVGFMWLQGGDQFEIEEKLSLQFGFPAVIAISLKKERFGVHRGIFDKDSLSQFLGSMMVGRVPLQPLPKGLAWDKTQPWDGKDGEIPEEEEL
uniref:protein disulfide-isomerase n=1 Tax=Noctiluca scintillans TaxID=2966 RepID=A0A7S1FDJ3_NOCSC|mmetsp:Transcript_5211/g.14732  ORF Transcript_5211/g.14732 Transcript_5211/m.14732 type:complete len:296 (+) Transcript_5211:212-1099(+)|eukprot:CAMPEP_0194494726 /NCGR_PEP_ID=MMETSP0253-20130528/12542_1 /TAXON_ID=2966 /ORGANISM="Noctiluca scintillans" /LENGTH=295 /DNA_ID=CAMNT_0039335887 /DNA_START=180 /DNA_END=1067 /DNA_ORIENTATION=-